jgi:hypothetical protein
MMLGFPVKPLLKRFVTESVAYMDEMMARATDGGITPLPEDLPYNPQADLQRYVQEFQQPGSTIRVGFVGSGFNSKAVLYLSQDMFRFFDKDHFEIHIFSVGPADNPLFIQHGMRGVDWRQRVINNVGKKRFHDIQHMKLDHIKMARFIKKQDIHILIEWDGYGMFLGTFSYFLGFASNFCILLFLFDHINSKTRRTGARIVRTASVTHSDFASGVFGY